MLIGLTGGYCSGKNEVAALLASRGWTCFDVDRIGHEAVDLARDAIAERFGAAVIAPDGNVDRRAVARIVFSDPRALADQEAIVHPVAIRLLDERLAEAEALARAAGRPAMLCINAALLHRSGRIASCDAIVELRAPLFLRLRRGMRRDGAGALAVLRRIWSQRGFRAALRARSREAGRAVHVLRNRGGLDLLGRELDRLVSSLAKPTPSRGA